MARNLIVVPIGEHHRSTGKLKKSAKHEIKKTRKAIKAANLGETAVVLTPDTRRHLKAANMLAKAFVKSSVQIVPEIYDLDKEPSGKGVKYRSAQADRWLKATPAEAKKDSAVIVVAGNEYIRRLLATQVATVKSIKPNTLAYASKLQGDYDGHGEPIDSSMDVVPQALVFDPAKKLFKPLEIPQEEIPKAA